jgi:branched-chain amino acid transport system substrate-binding protein
MANDVIISSDSHMTGPPDLWVLHGGFNVDRERYVRFRGTFAALAILAILIMGSTALAQGPREPIKIGLLNPLTGFLAVNGTEVNEGIRLYWQDEMGNQVAGRPVRLIVEDAEGKPDVALTKVKKLVESDRVHLILGPVSSAVAVAIRDYVHEHRVPLIITQATANNLTSEKASPSIFRSAMSSYQQEAAGGWYVAAKLGHKRIALIALDYVAGHEQAEGFIKTFMESGGQSVDKVLIPPGAMDVAPYITRIESKAKDLDAAVGILWGPTAPQWLKAWQDYGLKGKLPLLTLGETVSETYLRSVGDATIGVVSWFSYSPVLDTPENKRFVQAFNKKYGKDPVYNNHLGYLAAKVGGEALKAVSGNVEDGPRFLDALRKVRFEAPGGAFRFDEKQNAVIPTYIRRVEKVGGKLQNTVFDVVPDVDQFWKPPKR